MEKLEIFISSYFLNAKLKYNIPLFSHYCIQTNYYLVFIVSWVPAKVFIVKSVIFNSSIYRAIRSIEVVSKAIPWTVTREMSIYFFTSTEVLELALEFASRNKIAILQKLPLFRMRSHYNLIKNSSPCN